MCFRWTRIYVFSAEKYKNKAVEEQNHNMEILRAKPHGIDIRRQKDDNSTEIPRTKHNDRKSKNQKTTKWSFGEILTLIFRD